MTSLEKIKHLEERLVVLESEKQAILKNLMSVQETCVLYRAALYEACDELMHKVMSKWCDAKCKKCKHYSSCVNSADAMFESFLQKAREENDTQLC